MGDIMIHVGDIMSTVRVFSTVGYSNNKRLFPHGTQDNPHGTHDIPHGTEHPHGTQDIPHGTHDIPHGTEPPRYS